MSKERGWRSYAPDAALAVAVAVSALVSAAIAPPGRTDLDLLGVLLLLAGSLALVARRRAPVAVLVVTTGCVLAYFLRGYPGVAAGLPVMVALFTTARYGYRLAAIIPATGLLVIIVADLTVADDQSARQVIQDRFLLAGWLVASAILGEAIRQWTAYVHEAEQRAAEAERTREEVARRRADEERLRIARELHDSLTHSISIIKVQAGVAVHLARKRGEEVPEALLAIQDASREAIQELRSTLEALREADGEPPDRLDRLEDLIESARSAGVPATLTVTGLQRRLPADIDRAAYRIVQEALTNVARHAGPTSAVVHVGYGPGAVVVQVDDEGQATPGTSPEPGVGLTGMRERVSALGGRLRAEPRPDGGFTVRAELPVREPS